MPTLDGLPVSVVLASASPRRRHLLESVGLVVEARPADIDETPHPREPPNEYVRRLALEKTVVIAASLDLAEGFVVGADTTVALDGTIMEKPIDDADARRMLRRLSGRSHLCHTGVTVRHGASVETIVVTTEVRFAELTDETIDWYVATGEAADKAGAYGIQGAAGAFVERVDGSVTNVIGLPLAETLGLLRRC